MSPRKWKQEAPSSGLTKLESKLVNDYGNELDIVTYGVLICMHREGVRISACLEAPLLCLPVTGV